MVRVERAEIFDVLKLQCFSPLGPYFYIFFKLPYHFHQMLKSRYEEGLINALSSENGKLRLNGYWLFCHFAKRR